MGKEIKKIEASLRIAAPAARIFAILTDPNRHQDFDGSGTLRDAVETRLISRVGDFFTIRMHRMGEDYLIINHLVEFVADRRLFWQPAPGDISRAEDHDPNKIGIPAGYAWGYVLTPDGDEATNVTEVFDCSSLSDDLLRDGGSWINGLNPVLESMKASLDLLGKISTQ